MPDSPTDDKEIADRLDVKSLLRDLQEYSLSCSSDHLCVHSSINVDDGEGYYVEFLVEVPKGNAFNVNELVEFRDLVSEYNPTVELMIWKEDEDETYFGLRIAMRVKTLESST